MVVVNDDSFRVEIMMGMDEEEGGEGESKRRFDSYHDTRHPKEKRKNE